MGEQKGQCGVFLFQHFTCFTLPEYSSSIKVWENVGLKDGLTADFRGRPFKDVQLADRLL